MNDNVKSRRMLPDGSYERVQPTDGEPEIDSQRWLIKNRGIWNSEE